MRTKNLCLSLLFCTVACGGQTTPWAPETANVRDPDGNIESRSIDEKECGGKGAADVYVDDQGKVVEVICYPPAHGEGTIVTVGGGPLSEDFETGNNDIVVLEGAPALEGDLEIDGNNVTLWGEDPSTAVLDGNLDVTKNNVLVSGITVTGDVHVTFNNAQFSNCVIEGRLILEGNNAKVAGCRVEGDVEIRGNNNELSANVLMGEVKGSGNNSVCRENHEGPEFGAGEVVACP